MLVCSGLYFERRVTEIMRKIEYIKSIFDYVTKLISFEWRRSVEYISLRGSKLKTNLNGRQTSSEYLAFICQAKYLYLISLGAVVK